MEQTSWTHYSQIPINLRLNTRYVESCGNFDLYELSNQQLVWVCYITGDVKKIDTIQASPA